MTEGDMGENDSRHEQPLDVLSDMVNKGIFIRLIGRTEVVGQLLDFDQYMNLKIGLDEEEILIRGNNVILIGIDWEDIGTEEATNSP